MTVRSDDEATAVARSADEVLAELPPSRQSVWRYYQLAGEAADGYPLCRPNSDGPLVAHPIHGTYMMLELLRTPGAGAVARAERLARACVSRMHAVDDTLRFMYRASDGLTPYPRDFYSALTQAHYLNVFGRLFERCPTDELRGWAERIYRSLEIPVSEGGVLLDEDGIVSLEEYPSPIPSFVLNGWLTVINEVFEYGYVMGSRPALALAKENAESVVRMLPTYDAPAELNSRYKLAGPVPNKLFFRGSTPQIEQLSIRHGSVELHSDAESPTTPYDIIHVEQSPSRGDDVLLVRPTCSIAGPDRRNHMRVHLRCTAETDVLWRAITPSTDPRFVTPKAHAQHDLRRDVLPPGDHVLETELPDDIVTGWAAAPTSFSKEIGGKRYNAYHYLHIKALTQLTEYHDAPEVAEWRDRWFAYTRRWPDSEIYGDADLAYGVVDHGSYPDERSYLFDPRVKLRNGQIVR